jgi:hypothetical protein
MSYRVTDDYPLPVRLFELVPTGDPYNKFGWDVREYRDSYDEGTCIFRGDLSPIRGKQSAIRKLRQLYPGCRVRVSK